MTTTATEFLTTKEAAGRLGLTIWGVSAAIRRGDLRGTMFGKAWMVTVEDLERWASERKLGRRFSDAPRCPCAGNTLRNANNRGWRCCIDAGISERRIRIARTRLARGSK